MPVIDTLKQIHIIHSIDICNVPVDITFPLSPYWISLCTILYTAFGDLGKTFPQSKSSNFLGFVKYNFKNKAVIRSHVNALNNISQDEISMVLA